MTENILNCQRICSGGNIINKILLTPDTFKLLCMQSNTTMAKEVRLYYIIVEEHLQKYKDDIIAGLEKKIKTLEKTKK